MILENISLSSFYIKRPITGNAYLSISKCQQKIINPPSQILTGFKELTAYRYAPGSHNY